MLGWRGRHLLVCATGAGLVALAAACSSKYSAGEAAADAAISPDANLEGSTSATDASDVDAACDPSDAAEGGDASAYETDALNCGRCGHSCAGGSCESGVCQPFLFATSDGETVIDLRLDSTRAIWTTSSGTPWTAGSTGQVYATTLGGSTPGNAAHTAGDGFETVLLAAPHVIGSLDSTASGVFVSTLDPTAPMIEKVQSTVSPTSSPGGSGVRLHAVGALLYYRSLTGTGTGNGTMVMVIDLLAPPSLNVAANVAKPIFDFAVLGTQSIVAAVTADAELYSCKSDGSCVVTLLDAVPQIRAFAADTTRIYWTADGHSVKSCAVTTGTCGESSTPLTLSSDTLLDIIVDHGALWATSSSNNIYMCPLPAGCPPNPPPFVEAKGSLYDATEYLNGHHFAASDTAFFWAQKSNVGVHQIMEVAR